MTIDMSNLGYSPEEIEDIKADAKATVNMTFKTNDDKVRGLVKNHEIVWIRVRNRGGLRKSISSLLEKDKDRISKETFQELTEMRTRLCEIRVYLGLDLDTLDCQGFEMKAPKMKTFKKETPIIIPPKITEVKVSPWKPLDLDVIQSQLDTLLQEARQFPESIENYEVLSKGLMDFASVMLGYMKSHFPEKSGGLLNHNATYWWYYVGLLSEVFFETAYCFTKIKKYEESNGWLIATIITADNTQEDFIRAFNTILQNNLEEIKSDTPIGDIIAPFANYTKTNDKARAIFDYLGIKIGAL